MRYVAFSTRNRKEILRDPLSMVFGIGFPLSIMSLISLMKSNLKDMPNDVFGMDTFAPGMAVFGLSFITIFLGTLVTNDRSTSFLMRLFASPLTGADYILGYSLPILPAAVIQAVVCFAAAVAFGMEMSINILLAIVILIPIALLYISMGLLMGSLLTSSQQVGGIGSVIVNVTAWLSGTWFSLEIMGGVFGVICYALPFAHAVDAVKAALSSDYGDILPHLVWVIGYTIIIYILAIVSFHKKMKG